MLGLDANMLGCRLVHAAAQAGLTEHCGAGHPSTFPAVAPAYRLDGLLTPADAGVRAGAELVRVGTRRVRGLVLAEVTKLVRETPRPLRLYFANSPACVGWPCWLAARAAAPAALARTAGRRGRPN